MVTIEEAVFAYGAAWNEPDEDLRHNLLMQCWADTGVVLAPHEVLEGRSALFENIGRFHEERPGWRTVLTSGLDVHHHVVRFSFAVLQPDGTQVSNGLDVGETGSDGRLVKILAFFGPLPALLHS